jgi:hypothetical protein
MNERYHEEAQTLVTSEYEFLRKEIATSIEETRNLERGALAITGILWAWFLTHLPVPFIAWLIPPVLVVLGAYRAKVLNRSFQLIARYLREREKALLSEIPTTDSQQIHGWETFREKQNAGVECSAYIFWCLLFLGSVIGAA